MKKLIEWKAFWDGYWKCPSESALADHVAIVIAENRALRRMLDRMVKVADDDGANGLWRYFNEIEAVLDEYRAAKSGSAKLKAKGKKAKA